VLRLVTPVTEPVQRFSLASHQRLQRLLELAASIDEDMLVTGRMQPDSTKVVDFGSILIGYFGSQPRFNGNAPTKLRLDPWPPEYDSAVQSGDIETQTAAMPARRLPSTLLWRNSLLAAFLRA
jgi:hypothetical protein